MSRQRVVVGLSGGVDSSVAAYLLQQQGYEVIGLFMRNWHDESVIISEECPWIEDSNDALMVAQKLGIPFQVIDLSETYKERIVDYMFSEYQNGRTPNPDVLCNREIKFDTFLNTALQLGADFVATGHYCRKTTQTADGKTVHQLLAGKDGNKDQSYFLCQLSQDQLSKALFPIGELTKPEVRAIAKELDLVTAEKKDSQGLCFIGKVRLPEFLQQQLKPKEGEILEVDAQSPTLAYTKEWQEWLKDWPVNGLTASQLQHLAQAPKYKAEDASVVGSHHGAHYFTIGQRKGLNVGGKAEPLFVISTDVQENRIYTGQGASHPGLLRYALKVHPSEVHWVREDLQLKVGETAIYQARIRYRQPLSEAKLYMTEDGLYVVFQEPKKAIAAGQFVAWYKDDELIGSGVISE